MFKPGQSGNPSGRKKGAKNKVPSDIVALIHSIHEDLEKSKKGLRSLAKKDPEWFYRLFYLKITPANVDVSGQVGIVGLAEVVKEIAESNGVIPSRDKP